MMMMSTASREQALERLEAMRRHLVMTIDEMENIENCNVVLDCIPIVHNVANSIKVINNTIETIKGVKP